MEKMDSLLALTREYIETLLSVHVTILENTQDSFDKFFQDTAPPMAGTSYNGTTLYNYFSKLNEKVIYDTEDCFFLKWILYSLTNFRLPMEKI